MNFRIEKLRQESFQAHPCISIERALMETAFYKENYGKYATPVMRALTFKHLCEKKTIYIGTDELIVGERGPFPKATPTFPELTCHTVEDLRTQQTHDTIHCFRRRHPKLCKKGHTLLEGQKYA
jgi:hypothetical protein